MDDRGHFPISYASLHHEQQSSQPSGAVWEQSTRCEQAGDCDGTKVDCRSCANGIRAEAYGQSNRGNEHSAGEEQFRFVSGI